MTHSCEEATIRKYLITLLETNFIFYHFKQLLCFWDGITLVCEACYRSDTFDLWNALWMISKGNSV